MAIKLKTVEERKLDKKAKKPKTKLEKAHKIFFIVSVILTVILFLYFIGCFAQGLIFAPLVFLWLVVVLFPTAITFGIIWTSEGYRNFILGMARLIGDALNSAGKIAEVLLKSLPYVGSVALAVTITYAILGFINLNKNKEEKKYLRHFIAGVILFALTLVFMIVGIVVLSRIKK